MYSGLCLSVELTESLIHLMHIQVQRMYPALQVHRLGLVPHRTALKQTPHTARIIVSSHDAETRNRRF